jgi:hypothetical protein
MTNMKRILIYGNWKLLVPSVHSNDADVVSEEYVYKRFLW